MKKLYFIFITLLLFAFALHAQSNIDLNTFPISLKYFEARKTLHANQLHWLAPCVTSEATFEVQHSTDGKSFTTINTITADQVRCTQPFDYSDLQRREGTNYYRIKMIAITNVSVNSFVVAVFNGNKGFEINALLPSLVHTNTALNISSAVSDVLQLFVTDLSGRRHMLFQKPVVAGNNNLLLDFSFLPSGKYILSAINKEKAIKIIQFVKQ